MMQKLRIILGEKKKKKERKERKFLPEFITFEWRNIMIVQH